MSSAAPPEAVGTRSARRTLAAVGAFVLPIVLAVAAMVWLAGRDSGDGGAEPVSPGGGGQVLEFTIPAGTGALMEQGYPVADVMPERVDLVAGDTMVVQNLDDRVHTFGPLTVRPGETTRLLFDKPGYYFGLCTVGTHDTVTIVVS